MNKLAKELKTIKNVGLVYLFGSSAKQGFEKAGDIDIAVITSRTLKPIARVEFQNRLALHLQRLIGKKVDVVVVNNSDAFLRNQILKYGKLLFERQEGADYRFRYRTISDYLSLKSLYDFFGERLGKKTRQYHG